MLLLLCVLAVRSKNGRLLFDDVVSEPIWMLLFSLMISVPFPLRCVGLLMKMNFVKVLVGKGWFTCYMKFVSGKYIHDCS